MTYPQNSAFIKLATGQYPCHEGDIRREHPEIPEDATWPNFPCPPTYAVVPWENPPEHNPATHCAIRKQPILVNGVWKLQWEVRPYTQEELDQIAEMATPAPPPPPLSTVPLEGVALTGEDIIVNTIPINP